MQVLFIGGTGTISGACARLALARGIGVTLLTRGRSEAPVPTGAELLRGDIRDPASVRAALGRRTFDAVVDWVAYEPEHVEADLELFRGRTGQYVFISSASAYQTPTGRLPVTESTPLRNPFWAYSRAKIACEERVTRAYRDEGFPVTIVRPSHTYDAARLPFSERYTVVDRMRRGAPVVVHGDGTSLWTLTHADDFATGFVGLLGNAQATGEAVHITSDEWLTWDAIYRTVAAAAGVESPRLVHAPSKVIARADPKRGAGLLGDKAHSRIFDNSKIKRLVPGFACTIPFSRGAEQILAHLDADASRRVADAVDDARQDAIVAAMVSFSPGQAATV